MRNLLIIAFFVMSLNAVSFIHPLDFKGTQKEKTNVIEYIKTNVKKTYSAIGMDNPSTLRRMEKKELEKFKILTLSKNRTLLNSVIQRYCEIGMCNYSTIERMYRKEKKALSEKLKW